MSSVFVAAPTESGATSTKATTTSPTHQRRRSAFISLTPEAKVPAYRQADQEADQPSSHKACRQQGFTHGYPLGWTITRYLPALSSSVRQTPIGLAAAMFGIVVPLRSIRAMSCCHSSRSCFR